MRNAMGNELELQPPASAFIRSVCTVLKTNLKGEPEELVAALCRIGIRAQAEHSTPMLWMDEDLAALYGDHVFITSPHPHLSVLLHRLPSHWQVLVNLYLEGKGWTGDMPLELELETSAEEAGLA